MSLRRGLLDLAKARIGALLPVEIFTPGLLRKPPTRVEVGSIPLSAADGEKIKALSGPVEVVLASSLALIRHVDLPSLAASRAEAAIGLQLRQTLPAQGAGVIWRSIVGRRSRHTTKYQVYIVKQALLQTLLSDLRDLGARVDRVSLDAKGLLALWERWPPSANAIKNWLGFSVLTAVLAGVGGIVGLAADHNARLDLISSLATQVAELEKRRDALQSDAGEGQKSSAAALNDMATFANQSRWLDVLADLTETLPDTVWISEFSASGDKLLLSGFTSDDVTDVINALQELQWAKQVQLNGTVSYDSYSRQSRFEIGILVAPRNPA